MEALCKFREMLVVAEVNPGDQESRCRECGASTLHEAPHGWMECEGGCGFAILKSDWERLRAHKEGE